MAGALILIVEGNNKNRKLVRDVLTFKSYEVIETETGGRGGSRRHHVPSPLSDECGVLRSLRP
jgi:CheY-like chemotaxis protein